MVPNEELHILTVHFEPIQREDMNLFIKEMSGPKVSFIMEAPLYYNEA